MAGKLHPQDRGNNLTFAPVIYYRGTTRDGSYLGHRHVHCTPAQIYVNLVAGSVSCPGVTMAGLTCIPLHSTHFSVWGSLLLEGEPMLSSALVLCSLK